jgi:hypothetical protein
LFIVIKWAAPSKPFTILRDANRHRVELNTSASE